MTKAESFLALSQKQKASVRGFSLFVSVIKEYYEKHKRHFAWRDINDPYKVYVSEVMLQQTQTTRVVDKYAQWIRLFPTWESLANAELVDVLSAWQGLGYNRRGKFLHQSAQIIVEKFGGILPEDPSVLVSLPGIGIATASSIAAFAYNVPTVFIETNIRAVFIHFFFSDRTDVADSEIFPLIEQTLDRFDARQWYYALMDYGVMLKKQFVNPSRKSKHHSRQSKFQGSDRQIRGAIIRALTAHRSINQDLLVSEVQLHPDIVADKDRIHKILEGLIAEEMIRCDDLGTISIS